MKIGNLLVDIYIETLLYRHYRCCNSLYIFSSNGTRQQWEDTRPKKRYVL